MRPGDRIHATIRLAAGRWVLSITDATSGAAFHKATREKACTTFGQAEWVQEDPRSGIDRAPVDYPELSGVRFAHLDVDGKRPPYASLFSRWMSLPEMTLAPSPLRDGSFLLHEAGPIGHAGSRYLRIAARVDRAAEAFEEEMAGWRQTTPSAKMSAQRAEVLVAMRANIRVLSSGGWPRRVGRPIARMVRAARVLKAQTEVAPAATATGLSRWKARWTKDGRELSERAHRVRRALHIPELTPPRGARLRKSLASLRGSAPACVRH